MGAPETPVAQPHPCTQDSSPPCTIHPHCAVFIPSKVPGLPVGVLLVQSRRSEHGFQQDKSSVLNPRVLGTGFGAS